MSNFMAELRRLLQYYEYRGSLKETLRYRLGVKHERTQQRLLSEGALLTSPKSIRDRSAIRQAAAIQCESQKENGYVNVFKGNKQKFFSCFRFTVKHSSKVCPFINKQCFCCKNKERIEKVCRKKSADENVRKYSSKTLRKRTSQRMKYGIAICWQFIV